MKKTPVLAIIPARSGSKSVPDKNIRDFAGKPLLAHSIAHARAAVTVDRVVLSTDSTYYAAIAREYGAETPFLRPAELADDDATDLVTFQHALQWLAENENYHPEIVVHLRPTYPLRNPQDIDRVVEQLIQNPEFDSVRSIAAAPATPFKMWFRGNDGLLTPVIEDGQESYNKPRQTLPTTYLQNACIDAVRAKVILEKNSMTGTRIHGYLMEEDFDIDNHAEFLRANKQATSSHPSTNMTFCFDIDGVIATLVPGNDYKLSRPRRDIIAIVNRLYDAGHRIVLNTARGGMTGIDWSELTAEQMTNWGVRHHQLTLGKPAADFYIDDRAISLTELLRITDILTEQ
jgi:CMP-N,N'-diacetyllegionaminic acid synthase